jgi:LPS export ABC transporter protein LptC
VVLGLRLLQSEAGRVRWVLRADSAQAQGEGERMRLWGVNLEFFGAGGDSVQSTLTSLEGEADPRSRELLARGNVVVATRGDRRLETEELRWDPEREKMISDVPVRLYKGLSVIRGTGIVADPDLGSYEIRAPVEGQVREEDRLLDGL